MAFATGWFEYKKQAPFEGCPGTRPILMVEAISSVYMDFVDTPEFCGYLAEIDTSLQSPYYLEHYDMGSYAPLTVHGGTHHHGYTQIHFKG